MAACLLTTLFVLATGSPAFPEGAIDAPGLDSTSSPLLNTQFTYKAIIPETPPGTKRLDVWLPIPSTNSWQTVEVVRIDADVPHELREEPNYGNKMAHLRYDMPVGRREITVVVKVARKHENVAEKSKNTGRYLAADAKVPVGGEIARMAAEITAGKTTRRDKMRAIYDYVVTNMQYDYKKESPRLGDGDVAFVCDYKKGNCSDLHSVVISLARSLGIPAYLEYGFPITGVPLADPLPKEGKIGGYHCWIWWEDDEQTWQPLDASDGRRWMDAQKPEYKEKLFGSLVVERAAVAFSKGRDIVLSPPQKGSPLNYFIYPYAEADGVPVKAQWEVAYTLLSP